MVPGFFRLPVLMILMTLIFTSFFLTGCGGGSDGGSSSATADAGSNQIVGREGQVTLDGSGSSDSSGAALSYQWQQTRGTDVTDGSGILTGVAPSFNAPNTVETLSFALTVNGSSADSVNINVLEHSGTAYFVDGDSGSDSSGDGSQASPYASIRYALEQIQNNDDIDVYVKTLADNARYDTTASPLLVPGATSLYGGYGSGWVRDVNATRTGVDGNVVAVLFTSVTDTSWFSGFDLTAADSANAGLTVAGVSVMAGEGTFYVEDNRIEAGAVGNGSTEVPASSYGLRLAGVSAARVYRNEIIAGSGAPGNAGAGVTLQTGADGGNGGAGGATGNNEDGGSAGVGASRDSITNFSNAGGRGGNGGTGLNESGGSGFAGDSVEGVDLGGGGGLPSSTLGGPGVGGLLGAGGLAGRGGMGIGNLRSDVAFYEPAESTSGAFGKPGRGGGGGGGGDASTLGFDGGGGGGGGGGGAGGRGSPAARSGGASIGIAVAVSDTIIENNIVTSGGGGDGGNARGGAFGGNGGNGQPGAAGASNNSGDGGWGGGGGSGGQGGQGGGGGGGPSVAILLASSTMPTINNNSLTSGTGGAGGAGSASGLNGRSGLFGGAVGSNGRGGRCCSTTTPLATRTFAEGGYSFGVYDDDTSDGMSPVLSGNTFTVGEPGLGAATGGEDGLADEMNF